MYFSLAKFQRVSCNLSLAMIWQITYTHKLPKLCSATLKKGTKYCRNNYRQVSITSIVSVNLQNKQSNAELWILGAKVGLVDGSRLRHVGPAVVPRFETCGKRVKKPSFHSPLLLFSTLSTHTLSGYLIDRTELAFPFSALTLFPGLFTVPLMRMTDLQTYLFPVKYPIFPKFHSFPKSLTVNQQGNDNGYVWRPTKKSTI